MDKRSTFAATTVGKSFCPRPPVLSRRTSLEAAVDKNMANAGVISADTSRVAVRVIRTDEE
jgi:acetate kinase